MHKTADKYAPELRERAVQMFLNGEWQHQSRWMVVAPILSKVRYAPISAVDTTGENRAFAAA